FRELANSLPDIVFEIDMAGRLTFSNKMGYETSGYSQEDLEKGLNVMEFLLPEEREKALKKIQLLVEGGGSFLVEYTLVRKNGTTFPAIVSTSPIVSEKKVMGLRGLAIDITERKKSEEALNQTMDKLVLVNEKLYVIGRLTRHDISNKLSGIGGNIYLLRKLHSDCPDIIQRLNSIDDSCRGIVKILDFAKMYEELGAK